MDASLDTTGVNLDGLLDVLGKNLYSSPNVAVRELIQNACDACERHKIEGPTDNVPERDYYVRLICKPETGQLIITDNGSGLTRDEIITFLATIGSGYSRLLRQQSESEDVVGYFGLGFLSAYVVSSKVEVITTSYQDESVSWKFTSAKGKTYALAPTDTGPVGTKVTLNLEPDYMNLSRRGFLERLVQKYCCLMQIPIYLNADTAPINNLEPPWLAGDMSPLRRQKLNQDFAEIFEPTYEPIAVFPIPADNDLKLKGLIWVQGGGSFATSDTRNISIFTRNMFITHEDKDLLPRWAGFCGGLLESAHFRPTASRESLQADSYYRDVQSYLHEFLTLSLRDLVAQQPASWRRVLTQHSQALLGAAVSDDRLFDATWRSLKLPTSDGEMTLPQLLSRGDGSLYIKPGARAGHEEVLFRARGNPLVKGYLYGATAFCQKYKAHNNVNLYVLGTQGSRDIIFPPAAPSDELKEKLTRLFESEKYAVAFTKFTPADIPLIVMEDHDVVLKSRLESDAADKRISMAALSLARLHTAQNKQEKERVIFINLDNNLIQKLPDLRGEKQNQMAKLLINLLEFLCLDHAQLDHGLSHVFSSFDAVMTALLTE